MTLILGLATSKNLPLLLGDILISAPGGRPVHLPTVGPVVPKAPGVAYQPSGLRQKVCLIASNCALAWAGSVISARLIVKALRQLPSSGSLTLSRIERCFREHASELQDVNVIGFLSEAGGGSARHYPFCWGVEEKVVSGVKIWVAGTGANHFEPNERGEWENLLESTIGDILDSVSPEKRSEEGLLALQLQSGLLGRELISGATLHYMYGGGYEIAAQVGGGVFSKFQDAVYVYAFCDFDHAGVTIHKPFRLSRLRYAQRELLIYNVDYPFEDIAKWECFVVPDIENVSTLPNIPEQDLARVFTNSLCTCFNLVCRVDGKIIAVAPALVGGPEDERGVAILGDDSGHIRFRMNLDFVAKNILPSLLPFQKKARLQALSAHK